MSGGGRKREVPTPTERQIAITRSVVEWYLDLHFGKDHDPGVLRMFCDPTRVGAFACKMEDVARGDSDALFKLLVTVAMFQRRQDLQIMRILRGISEEDAQEITSVDRLMELVDASPCPLLKSNDLLLGECDLGKDPATGLGMCGRYPGLPCHLKRHTVLLKRYGHFGKMPTSAALVVKQEMGGSLAALYAQVLSEETEPLERAKLLERRLSAIWRVSQKIACMYLSLLTNPTLNDGVGPWVEGVSASWFVVVDSNVDLFLSAIEYRGYCTYDARRSFVKMLGEGSRLGCGNEGKTSLNPRLVQQAIYLFMSTTNRRHISSDCSHQHPASCHSCSPLRLGICEAAIPIS